MNARNRTLHRFSIISQFTCQTVSFSMREIGALRGKVTCHTLLYFSASPTLPMCHWTCQGQKVAQHPFSQCRCPSTTAATSSSPGLRLDEDLEGDFSTLVAFLGVTIAALAPTFQFCPFTLLPLQFLPLPHVTGAKRNRSLD